VDDERRYRELLELNFTRRGYRVTLAADGLAGLNALERDSPDIVILDLSLPDMDGLEVCRRIRAYSQVPVIMLTARGEEVQKVRGLRAGADDYVTKPFGAEELLARVEAVLRRGRRDHVEAGETFHSGDLAIDFAHRQVSLAGRGVDLTATEYRLLEELARNAGRVVVQEELLRRVWGEGYRKDAAVLHTAIRRLRRKLDNGDGARYILTRRGLGYVAAKMPAA
jgi:DNA-binding response OmpR family regulator